MEKAKDSTIITLIADKKAERLDTFLAEQVAGYSRSFFHRLIKEGFVTSRGMVAQPSDSVKVNDEIVIEIVAPVSGITAEKMKLDIIHEDADILVVNKAPGVVVHPACGHQDGTLLNGLAGYAGKKWKPLLAHRLDKDTSGVIVIAKNDRAKTSLSKQFEKRVVSKTYLAAVSGEVQERLGYIEAPLGRSPIDRKKIAVSGIAKKEAVTEFTTIFSSKNYSLLEVHPKTGRTHQIRSHLAYIGHPVLGDSVYGGKIVLRGEVIKRQLLHAYRIKFTHPTTCKSVEYTARPPKDIAKLWPEKIRS